VRHGKGTRPELPIREIEVCGGLKKMALRKGEVDGGTDHDAYSYGEIKRIKLLEDDKLSDGINETR